MEEQKNKMEEARRQRLLSVVVVFVLIWVGAFFASGMVYGIVKGKSFAGVLIQGIVGSLLCLIPLMLAGAVIAVVVGIDNDT